MDGRLDSGPVATGRQTRTPYAGILANAYPAPARFGGVKPAVSLGVAVACVALAIAIVAVDMQFAVRVDLQSKSGETYRTVASGQDMGSTAYPRLVGCAGPAMRLVVHNDQPWGSTVRVRVEASGPGPARVLVDESWTLAKGESRSAEFTVPAEVFTAQGPAAESKATAYVTAQVGDEWLSACVEEAA